jgi:hypothetical protein
MPPAAAFMTNFLSAELSFEEPDIEELECDILLLDELMLECEPEVPIWLPVPVEVVPWLCARSAGAAARRPVKVAAMAIRLLLFIFLPLLSSLCVAGERRPPGFQECGRCLAIKN